MSRKIPQVKTLLREVGIVIERPVDTGTNTKLIEIRKTSPEAPVSPEDKNQAQKEHDNSGDILSGNGLSPKISPEINGENQAQKQQSGDSGDTGDILHMSTGTLRLVFLSKNLMIMVIKESRRRKKTNWFGKVRRQHIA